MDSTVNIVLVKEYVKAFNLNYQKAENDITKAFAADSSDEDVIEKRIHLLNVHYHTRIPRGAMKDVIISLWKTDFLEEWIKNGNEEAVKRIADCNGKNYFSFATKYCCFSNPDKYPIFDSLSIKALQKYNENKDFYGEKIDFEKLREKKLYGNYKEIINSFRNRFELDVDEFNYKNLDKFLWLVGKNI